VVDNGSLCYQCILGSSYILATEITWLRVKVSSIIQVMSTTVVGGRREFDREAQSTTTIST
jgi:hypothetical protein